MPSGVYRRTKAHRRAISLAHIGLKRRFSKLHRLNLSIAMSGKKLSRLHKLNLSKSHKGVNVGRAHPAWKPWAKLNYKKKHCRIKRLYGRPYKCENRKCLKRSKNYQWSNKSRKYKSNRKDWQMLCVSCHVKYDREKIYGKKISS